MLISYLLIRFFVWPFQWLSHKTLHRIGRCLGWIGFFCLRDYRKRTLSNLSLAKDLSLDPVSLVKIAKKSFQNLAINCLEYAKLSHKVDSSKIYCENPEEAETLYRQGKGIIFFCGHQSNWEVLFLDGTTRMRGMAIGKPIKNAWLYRWITSIREKNGGTLITPRNALREGLKALKKGTFLGIVGDQGMPGSGYSFPFLGRRAWTSTAPALLAYRTQSPLIFAETRRVLGGYVIRYSEPIWPNPDEPMDKEVVRLMDLLLQKQQESIRKRPDEWLWQHNRWKQQTPQVVKKEYRHDSIAVILPGQAEQAKALFPALCTLKMIYPDNFLFVFTPTSLQTPLPIETDEILPYQSDEELFRKDFRFKLVFDFTKDAKLSKKLKKHYLRLSTFLVLDVKLLEKLSSAPHLSEQLIEILCRKGSKLHAS